MFKPTSLDELRRPHPDQQRIDAELAQLLRKTVEQRLDRIYRRPTPPSAPALDGKSGVA
jgi:hypothetical protein